MEKVVFTLIAKNLEITKPYRYDCMANQRQTIGTKMPSSSRYSLAKKLVLLFPFLPLFGVCKATNFYYQPKQFTKVSSDHFYATGTFVINDKEISPLAQVTAIECTKDKGECIFSNASQAMSTLQVDIDTLPIHKWDSNEILVSNNMPMCTYYVYKIDLVKQDITGYRNIKLDSNLNQAAKERCSKNSIEKELTLRLEDGNEWTKRKRKF